MPRGKQTSEAKAGRIVRLGSILASAIFASGCSDSGPVKITEERVLAPTEREILIADSSAERFRSRPAPAAAPKISFDFDLPDGWSEAPKTSMRVLNFSLGENREGECYLTLLPGAAGGVEANVNRWRGQMGLEPAGADEIAALSKKKLFGREAVFVSLDGDFQGFGASEPKKDYRMLGLILWSEQVGAVFAKMTGPRELVEAQAENFDTFCGSIRPE